MNILTRPLLFCCLILSLCTLLNCGSSETDGDGTDGGDPASFDRATLLQNTSALMFNAYTVFQAEADVLQTRVEVLATQPNEDLLITARRQWIRTAQAWQRVHAFHIGPVKSQNLDLQIGTWPVRSNTIDTVLLDTSTLTPAYMAQLDVRAKGLATLEYILFERPASASALIRLTEDRLAARRRNYLRALVADLKVNADTIVNLWKVDGGGFVDELGNAESGTTTYPSFQSALSVLINEFVFTIEVVRHDKVGIPLGVTSVGQAEPELVEAFFSGTSLELISSNMDGLEAIYFGRDGGVDRLGLHEYVAFLSPGLEATVASRFAAVRSALGAFDRSLQDAVLSRPALVEDLYNALQDLVQVTRVEMSNALSVTISFKDRAK